MTVEDLSLHILDIAENAIRARAKTLKIELCIDKEVDRVTLIIDDDGDGMDSGTVKNVRDPFFTTKPDKKVGLGLSLLAQSAEQTGGSLKIESKQGEGTTSTTIFNRNHPDMIPLGDILETILALFTGNPDVRIIYTYTSDDETYGFDSLYTP